MSTRALIIGFLLGLWVSSFTYVNHAVIHSTLLTGNFLPVGVFGISIFLLLAVNPLLRMFNQQASLRTGELAVITAVGLAACAWPGSNFYRVATTNVSMPLHWNQTQSSWKANHVMSYVPGQSPEIAQGHVTNWERLTTLAQLPRLKNGSAAPQ